MKPPLSRKANVQLRTDRLSLRPFSESDEAAFFAIQMFLHSTSDEGVPVVNGPKGTLSSPEGIPLTPEPGVQRGGRALKDSGDRAFAHALLEIGDNLVFVVVEFDPCRGA